MGTPLHVLALRRLQHPPRWASAAEGTVQLRGGSLGKEDGGDVDCSVSWPDSTLEQQLLSAAAAM